MKGQLKQAKTNVLKNSGLKSNARMRNNFSFKESDQEQQTGIFTKEINEQQMEKDFNMLKEQ